jgi:myo-inositol-1(or 4)-monophosphatase
MAEHLDLASLLELALDAAGEAGRLVRERREEVAAMVVAATKSSPTDVVTASDTAAEQLLRARLLGARPQDSFLGEEGAADEGTSGVRWVVDPIDGTVNYLYGIPAYAVSVAATSGGEPLVGVVHNPVSGETWTATRGGGARLDGRRLRVSGCDRLDRALVATGFGYESRRRAHQADVLRQVLPRVRDIRRAGAASLDLCALASARVDAYYERGLKPWDLAAGGLVAREAGAVVGGLSGAPAGEDIVVAAGPALFRPLHDLLLPLGADRDG